MLDSTPYHRSFTPIPVLRTTDTCQLCPVSLKAGQNNYIGVTGLVDQMRGKLSDINMWLALMLVNTVPGGLVV